MTRQSRTSPAASERSLHQAYDTALLDLDGVVYAGGEAIAHAVDSLAAARADGMHLAYVTNNALRTPDAVAEHLGELGIPTEAGEVITSAQAVARLISEQVATGSKVLVIGGEGLRVALRERGLEPVDSADEEGLAAVVQGYGGPGLEWARFAEAAYAINRGVPWFASNTDLTIPGARGIGPGNGAAVEVVRIATGAEPQVAGKPQTPMHRETVLRTGAKRPLVVGDRLDTDIEGAFNGEVDSLLVLTGVTDAARLLRAEPRHRPTYVDRDLRGLLTGQPEVREEDGAWACGGWSALVEDGVLELRTEPARAADADPVDGLRALCAAAWSEAGDGAGTLDAEKALARLEL
ncbi:HAD hydrolase-like protein [Streptomyces subrutilus]|uniref:HAD family hydrolase n=1 Tax=Streptomyces subrutilus TaxID=36818 RepID=A0A5P2USH0_9ACTN|nr:HAD hydrolase-like protein [Streptomyces subrutilus]QEU81225.1 HAD family hydrolase [Streptomyces subrutilus]WSJ29452.1 HAD hydrolase-like protein [Streptomyces subrutilus]GGZ99636.1 haloacid dehalogenase [Streptomyces subrutilus]